MYPNSTNQNEEKNRETPLSIFQEELAKHKSIKKSKKFLYIVLPVVMVVLIVSGYFVYRYLKDINDRKNIDIVVDQMTERIETELLQNIESGKTELRPEQKIDLENFRLQVENGLIQQFGQEQ